MREAVLEDWNFNVQKTGKVQREIERKESRITLGKGKSFRRALVYEGHLAPIVEADGYFDAIVPFRRLLNI